MEEVARMTPQPVVAIRPNKDCGYAVFANVLSTSKRKGLDKMTVLGAEQFVQ
jgi:biopolymer transport protein ExbD